MKIWIVILLLVGITNCGKKNKTSTLTKKEAIQNSNTDSVQIYQYKTEIFYHILELKQTVDSVSGVYTGAEVDGQARTIYYQSEFKIKRSKDPDSLNFNLKYFNYSLRPFKYITDNSELLHDSLMFPIDHGLPLRFRGKIYGDFIELQRTYAMYDNRVDFLIFLKDGYDRKKGN